MLPRGEPRRRGEAWLFGVHAQLAMARTWLAAGEPERHSDRTGAFWTQAGAMWRDTAAAAAVVVAGCEHAVGRPDAAADALTVALSIPGAPAAAWEARLELARPGRSGSGPAPTEARDMLERVLAQLDDDPAAAALAAASAIGSATRGNSVQRCAVSRWPATTLPPAALACQLRPSGASPGVHEYGQTRPRTIISSRRFGWFARKNLAARSACHPELHGRLRLKIVVSPVRFWPSPLRS